MWNNIKDSLPEVGEEVLVWVDGHRSPAWSNNYALVAYRETNGNFYQERHRDAEPLVGVLFWAKIERPKIK